MSSHPVGASVEVAVHHATQHRCTDGHAIEQWCPCGSCFIVLCSECGDAVFLVVNPARDWCRHALTTYAALCEVAS